MPTLTPAPATRPASYDACEACGADLPGGGLCDLCARERDPNDPAPATPAPDPILLHRTGSGYTIYGSDAEVAGPILGLALTYVEGDFAGSVAVDARDLPAAVAALEAAGERAAVVEGRRAA